LTKVAIVTATLSEEMGNIACQVAVEHAGINNVPYHVSVDEVGQGGVKTATDGWEYVVATYKPQYLCYINDDVRARQPGWLKRLVEVLESDGTFGIAAPGGACVTNPQRRARPGMRPGIFEVNSLAFFCVVIKSDVLKDVGMPDRDYIHFAADSDYCKRAQKAGWKCLWVRDVWVQHTFVPVKKRDARVQRWKHRDMALYYSKWGKPKR
jgi:GT2 family glycosyltransferase